MGVEKRQRILQAALDVVATKGYGKASVREIAEVAGVSPASLMHYFGTKNDLFIAILEARDAQDEAIAGGTDIFSGFLSVMRHNVSVPGLVQLYTQMLAKSGDPNHPAQGYFRDRNAFVHELGLEAVKEAQRAGSIRDDLDPAWVVRTARALADGLQASWLLDPAVDMASDLEQFLQLLRPPDLT